MPKGPKDPYLHRLFLIDGLITAPGPLLMNWQSSAGDHMKLQQTLKVQKLFPLRFALSLFTLLYFSGGGFSAEPTQFV